MSCIYSLTTSQHTFTSHVSAKPRLKTHEKLKDVLLCLLNIMESKSHRDLLSLKCAQNFHTHHVSYVKHDTMLCASQYECFLFILLPSQRRRPNLHFWEMMLYIRRNSGCYHTDMSIIENI